MNLAKGHFCLSKLGQAGGFLLLRVFSVAISVRGGRVVRWCWAS